MIVKIKESDNQIYLINLDNIVYFDCYINNDGYNVDIYGLNDTISCTFSTYDDYNYVLKQLENQIETKR